jgi:hypothetical protein
LSHAHKSFIPLGIHAYIFDLLLLVISEEMFRGDDIWYTFFEFVKNDISRRNESRVGSVGIALGYVLDDRGSSFRFPVAAGAENFSLHHRVQNGSGAHPASYPVGTGGFFPGGKAAGA